MSISLADEKVQDLTLQRATDPKTSYSLLKMRKEIGYEDSCAAIARLLEQADVMLGYTPKQEDGERYMRMAANTLIACASMSLGSILIAIRDGMNSTSKEDKAFGKLNIQLLNTWIANVDKRILSLAESEHEEKKAFFGLHGNHDSRYLDKMEDAATNKGEVIRGMAKEIQDLRKKLRTKDE